MQNFQYVEDIIKVFESRFVDEPYEYAVVISRSGEVVVGSKTDYLKRGVNHNEEQKSLFKDNIFIHNHPKPGVIYGEYREIYFYSFSSNDIFLAFCRELAEIRAVDFYYSYSLKPKSRHFRKKEYCSFLAKYDCEYALEMNRLDKTYGYGHSDEKDEEELKINHNILKRITGPRSGYLYTYTPRSHESPLD
jgi:hypothetical protein